MDGFAVEALARLPLARAVLELFSYVLDESHLGDLFERHRGRCYERELTFAEVVYLLRDALLVHGSGHAGFEAAKEAGALPVAVKNVYEKLGRFPLELSTAFLRQGTLRLCGLSPRGRDPLPASLAGLAVVAFDGKKIKNAAKRLKPLRGLPGRMLGGKLLAAMDVRAGLALAMQADPDGERNDVPLVPGLVAQVRGVVQEAILWMGDRQFGANLDLPALLCGREGDHFLLRCTTALSFHPDEGRPPREGLDGGGRRWVQRWGWVGSPKDDRRRYVRQVVLYRPQEDDVILITDLLDEGLHPAADLLGAYLLRWGIECMFQKVTEVFDLARLIGSTPKAMIFQSAFCFVLYNLTQVIRAHVARGAGRDAAEVSTQKLFEGVCRQLAAWYELGEPSHAAAYFAPPPAAQVLEQRLALLPGGAWRDRWLKSRPKKRQPPKPKAKVAKGQGGHTSVWRVLREYEQQRARP